MLEEGMIEMAATEMVAIGSKVRVRHQTQCPYMTVVEDVGDGMVRCVWFENPAEMLETIIHHAALQVYA